MKKVIAIFAIATLTACGGGVSNNPAADTTSATVSTDTTTSVVDTTATK